MYETARFLLPLSLSGCAIAAGPPTDTCIEATLQLELDHQSYECASPANDDDDGKADRQGAIDTPGLRFLRDRSEDELAALFAEGRADMIPLGRNDGTPLLLGYDWLAPLLSRIYVGSIWQAEVDAGGAPTVRLYDAWLRTSTGHLVTLFEADVTLGRMEDLVVAPGIAPPSAPSRPHPWLGVFENRLVLDDRPSIFVNYHDDPTPIINRIVDEIREVDPVAYPGLYLGRAHYRRPGGEWVYLYWFALDFGSSVGDS